jgi:hypothetical protein
VQALIDAGVNVNSGSGLPHSAIYFAVFSGCGARARGSVTVRSETFNQHGETAQILTAKLVVPRRPAA